MSREERMLKAVRRKKIASCADARKAIGATWSYYYMKKPMDKGLVKRIARDQYVAVR